MKKLILILVIILTLNSCKEKITYVRGKVISKSAFYNHNIHETKYITVINCNDGWIREKIGLEYYIVPVGDSITIKLVTYE